MKNNEFFKALNDKRGITNGEAEALFAWKIGIKFNLDFPCLPSLGSALRGKSIQDFLATIEKAGFKKFAYYSNFDTVIAFIKAGWKVTGALEIKAIGIDVIILEKGE